MAGKPRHSSGRGHRVALYLAPAEREALEQVAAAHGLSLSRLVGSWALASEAHYRRWVRKRYAAETPDDGQTRS